MPVGPEGFDAVALLAVAARHGFDVVLEGPGLPPAAVDLVGP